MATTTATRTYKIDKSHSEAIFQVRHLVTKVRGRFTDFEGAIEYNDANPEASTVNFSAKTASIDTAEADRDKHLRSADFFDADNNKEITFSSTKVERDGDDWVVTGDLSIKGETKPVTVVFEPTGSARDPFGNLRIGFEGGTSINRKDWGLTWNAALETGGVLVSEKVKLEFDVSAIRNA